MAENITLIAIDPLTPYRTPTGEGLQPSPGSPAIIGPGTRLPVVGCVDEKHFMVPKVRLQDGRLAYILEGKFSLERKAFLLILRWPIVLSC